MKSQMSRAACKRPFPPRAKALVIEGKLYHPRCDTRAANRLAAKQARITQTKTSRRKRKAIDFDAIAQRDRGVCASCGFDTTRIRPWIEALPTTFDAMCNKDVRPFQLGRMDRFATAVPNGTMLGRHRARALVLLGRLWGVVLTHGTHFAEIDHIQALAEGGDDSPSNLATLCRKCHARKTAEHAARRARLPTKGVGRGF